MEPIEQTKYEKLFSTPLFRFRVTDEESLNKELMHQEQRLRSQSEGVEKSNRGGWHSAGNLFEQETPCIQTLKEASQAAVLQATGQINNKVDPKIYKMKMFAWMNSNPPGGFNAPHTHPGAHWSGVYYVSQPKVENGSSGKIEFLNPRTDLPNWRIFKASAFSAKKSIRPQPGDLILFPSYLVHWVYPNETEEERVTVAFNATLRISK